MCISDTLMQQDAETQYLLFYSEDRGARFLRTLVNIHQTTLTDGWGGGDFNLMFNLLLFVCLFVFVFFLLFRLLSNASWRLLPRR
jgi:hypothetical protein